MVLFRVMVLVLLQTALIAQAEMPHGQATPRYEKDMGFEERHFSRLNEALGKTPKRASKELLQSLMENGEMLTARCASTPNVRNLERGSVQSYEAYESNLYFYPSGLSENCPGAKKSGLIYSNERVGYKTTTSRWNGSRQTAFEKERDAIEAIEEGQSSADNIEKLVQANLERRRAVHEEKPETDNPYKVMCFNPLTQVFQQLLQFSQGNFPSPILDVSFFETGDGRLVARKTLSVADFDLSADGSTTAQSRLVQIELCEMYVPPRIRLAGKLAADIDRLAKDRLAGEIQEKENKERAEKEKQEAYRNRPRYKCELTMSSTQLFTFGGDSTTLQVDTELDCRREAQQWASEGGKVSDAFGKRSTKDVKVKWIFHGPNGQRSGVEYGNK